eukprot:Hpha_TRINITY_DN17647_c0_g1::TRINITY_DN17647_c0_g1_i1::g.158702::m.158702
MDEFDKMWAVVQEHGKKEEWREQMCVLARMVPLVRKQGNKLKESQLWSNLGVAYQKQGLNDKAYDTFIKYKEACEVLGDMHRMSVATGRIADALEALGRSEEASEQRALSDKLKAEAAEKKKRDREAAITAQGSKVFGSEASKAASIAAAATREEGEERDEAPKGPPQAARPEQHADPKDTKDTKTGGGDDGDSDSSSESETARAPGGGGGGG